MYGYAFGPKRCRKNAYKAKHAPGINYTWSICSRYNLYLEHVLLYKRFCGNVSVQKHTHTYPYGPARGHHHNGHRVITGPSPGQGQAQARWSPAPLWDYRHDRFIRVDLAMSIPLLEPCTARLWCTLSQKVYITPGPRAHFPKKCTSCPAPVHTFPKVYIAPGYGAHFPKKCT